MTADTQALARSLGLQPLNTLVCGSQSNAIAKSFADIFHCDDVLRMDCVVQRLLWRTCLQPSVTSMRFIYAHR